MAPHASHELDGESMADDELRALEREADAAVLARVEKESLGGEGATMEHPSKAPATMEHPSKAPATITMEPTPAQHLQP